jgi:hypothetical protein
MCESKNIDLSDFGIIRVIDARDIMSTRYIHLQNNELSRVIVLLKNGQELKGPVLPGSDAVKAEEELFRRYQQVIGGG